ncbi:phytanoyl-CoA dioxygenase family protein [Dactylosporangium salmoneum]|uniref:Proline-4-hydroxylase n=3 Tax=Bacteria TaxID=2 RepID=A0A1Z1W292_ECOW3|nr:trans-4-proline-L-hydroxylase [synthetic construct]AMQ81161.1 proline-4-hydroxylase [Escherichia coli BL21]ARX80202.1 proline-4-hydroxylase [Escherichia coli str. K-12 substr. W3110]BAA20094.1 L-proline 4-hydroxylase [Dactylosporangium sp.]
MLTPTELKQYREAGYLLIEDGLGPREVDCLRRAAAALYAQDSPDRTLEKDGRTVRAVHGCHRRDPVCRDLVRHPRLLGPAMQILSGDVYVHQFKINAKAPMTGDVWPWHQDYIFWAREDGMDRPHVVNVAVLLDEATHLNGPLLFVPGTHELGLIDVERRAPAGDGDAQWLPQLSADLDYAIDADLLARLTAGRGIESATGPAGSILLFDSRIVHGSGTNMSPHPRGVVLVTYNRTDNALPAQAAPRPEFLAARDATPLVPLPAGFALAQPV